MANLKLANVEKAYGEVKAATWKAPAPVSDPAKLEAAVKAAAEASAAADAQQQVVGALAEAARAYTAEIAKLAGQQTQAAMTSRWKCMVALG